MIILPCLPIFLTGGYLTYIFLLSLFGAAIIKLCRM